MVLSATPTETPLPATFTPVGGIADLETDAPAAPTDFAPILLICGGGIVVLILALLLLRGRQKPAAS
ncbi:MAG: hypothetical protein NZ750_05410 [Anaerolineae bacterium]|nr:hypothetical protein [Anaerolineae bacterium]